MGERNRVEVPRLKQRLGGAGNGLLPLLIGPCLAMSSGFLFSLEGGKKSWIHSSFRLSPLILEEAESEPTGFSSFAEVSSFLILLYH